MFYALESAGWNQEGDFHLGKDDSLTARFVHKKFHSANLDITISFVEFPAITTISLCDVNGAIEDEWMDDEIDVDDITRSARQLDADNKEDEEDASNGW